MIPLVVSPYSFRGSVVRFENLVDHLKDIGLKSVVIADTNLHGAVIFNELMRSNGLIPVHGLIIGKKVLIARNRDGFENLVRFHNGEMRKLRGVVLKDLKDFKIVMYLKKGDRDAYEAMKRVLGLEPLNGDFSLEGRFEDAFEVFKAVSYDLKVNQIFKDPPDDWIDLSTLDEKERKRAERELWTIEKLGFKGYFHAVERVVKKAESMNVKVGPGRGSAVGSFLLYLLGITKINPLDYNLLFERFLNEGRKEPPDVDIDVEDVKRKDLIKALGDEFKFVSLVSTFVTLKEKLLERESARLGLKNSTAEKLKDLPIRRSVHAAAVVLSDSLLNVPLIKDDLPICEYDMESLKSIGVEKLDILGLKTLTFLKGLSKRSGVDPGKVGFELGVFESISKGFNTGIFQLESKEARRISRFVSPRNTLELSHLLALNRPGPLKARLHIEYFKRRVSKCWRVHPDLGDILEETMGIFLYQEQIMLALSKLADLTLEEADDLRKAISKKDETLMKGLLEKVRKNMLRKYEDEFVEETIKTIKSFSSYAFNKSHSVAYAYLSYWLSYFKTKHFPEFFLTFAEMNPSDRDKIFRLVCEARLRGFDVKVSVLHPEGNFEGDTVYLPLRIIPGINEKMEKEIVSKGSRRIQDLSFIPGSTLQNLVKVGAFDEIYSSRVYALKILRKGEKIAVFEKLKRRLGEVLEEVGEETGIDRISMEYDVLSFSLTRLDFNSRLSRISESISRIMELPSHVFVKNRFMSDGICTLKTDLDDGEYLVVVDGDGNLKDFIRYDENTRVIYELEGLEPVDEILEDGVEIETVLSGEVECRKKRPLIDSKIRFSQGVIQF